MKLKVAFAAILITVCTSATLSGQQTEPQVASVMQSVLGSMQGNNRISDVTLTGAFQRFAGSDQDSGTIVLKGTLDGSSRLDLNLPSGQIADIRTLANGLPVGNWIGRDGSTHAIPYHNLLTEPTWFFPLFVIAHGADTQHYLTTYMGKEIKNSVTVQHFQLSAVHPTATAGDLQSQQLSSIDLYLDSSTLLPAAIDFATHPDNDARVNLPVEIQFSEYQNTNGVQVPFHIQKLLNNSLVLDMHIQTVTTNSNLPASDFTVQ